MNIASLDIGLKRIGIALCLGSDIITPHEAILRKNRKQAANDVSDFLKEWDVQTLVVGVPMSGSSAEEMQRRIKHFVSLVNFEEKIVFIDEYGSSSEAKERMQGVTKQKRDGKVDSIAACIILERYLLHVKT